MAKKSDKRVSLVDAQLEIDGDKAFEHEHEMFDTIDYLDMMDWIDPSEEMLIEEERLREEAYQTEMLQYDPYEYYPEYDSNY